MSLTEKKPGGFLRWILRTPVWLYRLRLGWLLTGHFLMVTTSGRKTGLPRYAVIEVIQQTKVSGEYIVASGWGKKSDWFQNILKTPRVQVDVGFRRFQALAEKVEVKESALLLMDYARRFPLIFQGLAKTLTGERLTGTLEECTRFVENVPLVEIHASLPMSLIDHRTWGTEDYLLAGYPVSGKVAAGATWTVEISVKVSE